MTRKSYTCKDCNSEVKITIIAQRALVKDHLICPICGGELSPPDLGFALMSPSEMRAQGL